MVMMAKMIFGRVDAKVVVSQFPNNVKLVLFIAVDEPIEAHVD